MILDITGRLNRYESLHRLFPDAVGFLGREDLAELEDGRYDIGSSGIYAIVVRAVGISPDEALLEAHNDFIDIQVVLEGTDSIGWKSRDTCADVADEYDPEKDLVFYNDKPDTWTRVGPGQFAVFFPEDAHAPMVSPDLLHKVVIKVPVEG